MSTDENGRKSWNEAVYRAKAQERADFGEIELAEADLASAGGQRRKKRKVEWTIPLHERAALEKRSERVQLVSDLHKSKVVTAHTEKKDEGGFWCDTCDCLLKDSAAYLDHINGKNHNRLLGKTMRVEKKSKAEVCTRIEQLVRKKNQLEEDWESVKDRKYDDLMLRMKTARENETAKKIENAENRREKRRRKRKREEEDDEFEVECVNVPWLVIAANDGAVGQEEELQPVASCNVEVNPEDRRQN